MVTSNPSQIWLAESRQPIVDAVLDALRRLEQSKTPALLTLWGGRGVGKTLLLDSIESKIKDAAPNVAVQRWNLAQHSTNRIRDNVLDSMNAAESGQPLAILLDNLDLLLHKDIDGSDFFDLERDMFLPTVERGNIIFVTTSQIELTQWREDEVRQCQQSFQIPALSRRETNILIQDSRLDPESVYGLTFGHPKAIDWLRGQPALSDEAISERAADYFLEGLSPDAQTLASRICLMPLFNPFLLRSISESTESAADVLYLKHLDQIREFIGIGLVYWDVSVGAYRFRDNAVRRLLARGVQFFDPQLFQHVHKTAWEYYSTEARSPGYLHRHLVSAIYHLVNTQLSQEEIDVGTASLDWVRENTASWVGANWPRVLKMWVSGINDPSLAEEMKNLIGVEAFDAIANQIQMSLYNYKQL